MFKLHLLLFWEFMKIGLFAIGGGYAAIPFLFHLQERFNWIGLDELSEIIAVSNITPGPVGINSASYTGYKTAGITGSITASIAVLFLPFIITIIIIKLFSKFQNNKNVNYAFTGLRAAACALLAYIALKLFLQTVSFKSFDDFDSASLILFAALVIPFSFVRKNPVLTIALGAIGGVLIFRA